MDFGISAVPPAVSFVVPEGLSGGISRGTRIRLKSLDFGYQPDAHGTTYARKIALSLGGEKFVSDVADMDMSNKIRCTDGKSAERLVYSFEAANCVVPAGTPLSMSFLDECGREMTRVRYKVVPDSDSMVGGVSFSAHGRTYCPLVQLVGEILPPEPGPAVAKEEAKPVGRIKIKTTPAEVRVLLDGRFAGKTRSGAYGDDYSQALVIDNVPEGNHTLLMQHFGYEDLSVPVKVVRGKTATVSKRIKPAFQPDVEVLSNGGRYRGVLVGKTSEYVMIETKPGVQRCFPAADVQKVIDIGARGK